MNPSSRGSCYCFGGQGPAIKEILKHRHVFKDSLSERFLNH